jgi:aminoglycoside 6'-N-acetyltransferase I
VITVRRAEGRDLDSITRFRVALWPEGSTEEHATEAAALVAGRAVSTLPLALFVAELDAVAIGFIEVGLRSHADGCDPVRPVGFIEGWYVEMAHRRSAVGRALVNAAEEWARAHGCREIASDTWLDNDASQRAHEALGFEVVDRCVHFKKSLV